MTDLELLTDLGLSPMTPAEIAAFDAAQAKHRRELTKMLIPLILSGNPLPDFIAGLCAAYAQSVIDGVGAEIVRIVTERDRVGAGFWDRDPDEILTEITHEACDASNNQLIYTWNSRCYLMGSNNEGAYQDEIGEAAPSPEAAATMALIADVRASRWYTDAEAVLNATRTA